MRMRDAHAWTSLVLGYAKCGDMVNARKLFNEMPERNPVSWSAMISGYGRFALSHEAVDPLRRKIPGLIRCRRGLSIMTTPTTGPPPPPVCCLLQSFHRLISDGNLQHAVDSLPFLARRGIRPDSRSLALLLHRCLRSRSFALARRVHLHLKLTGFKRSIPSNTLLSNHIISLHFECGRPNDACNLFEKMPARNVFSYNAMLSGYAKLGMPAAAKRLFEKMEERDVVSWNTVIIAMARGGLWHDAVGFYVRMRKSFWGFNAYTFSGVLIACVRLRQLGLARQFHCQCLVVGFLENVIISSSLLDAFAKCGSVEDARKLFDEMRMRDVHAWTSLVSGYAKCGDLVNARKLFDEMPERNPVSWSAMISGYGRFALSHEAVDLFGKMMEEGLKPDQFVISSSLSACASIASIKHGKQIHAYLIRSHFQPNVIAVSSLIDMYSKCGDLVASRRIFDHTPNYKRDTVFWNTMISAFGQHGHGMVAIDLFNEMIRAGTLPDSNTFVVILTACSHSGLVEEGMHIFQSMSHDHGIIPSDEHNACFVDLLGRAGLLKGAKDWIYKLPSRSSALVWKALLGACRIHGNVELGSEAAEHLIDKEPQLSGAYVLLSNMFADVGRWESAEKVRCLMEKRQVRKERALSSFEIDNVVHSFGVSDRLHPLIAEVYNVSEHLACHVEDDHSIT